MPLARRASDRRDRRWTFLVVPEHEIHSAQFEITEKQIRRAAASAALGILTASIGLAIFLFISADRFEQRRLRQENALLTREVRAQREALTNVRVALTELQSRDRDFRLLAGLPRLEHASETESIAEPQRIAAGASVKRLDSKLGDLVTANAMDLDAVTRRLGALRSSWDQIVAAIQFKQDQMSALPSILPTVGFLSSTFSRHRAHPVLDENRPHDGVDIAAPNGTAVFAAARARVVFVGYRGPYGLMVELDHGHGYVTRYAHLARATVRVGDSVQRRAQIGQVGETGLAIGPHLHYEVLLNGVAQNPASYIFDSGAIPE